MQNHLYLYPNMVSVRKRRCTQYELADELGITQQEISRYERGETKAPINYIVDLIYEFYEKIGMFNENAGASKDITIDEDEVADFVMKCLKEDSMNHITKEMTEQVIEAEFAYCESIGIFE